MSLPFADAALFRFSFLTVAALLLGGCSLAPDYRRPDPVVPATLGADSIPSVSGVSVSDALLTEDELHYLSRFSPDANLARLVDQALAHNTDLRLAVLQVAMARAQYKVERSALVPAVAVAGQLRRQQFDNAELNERYGQNLSVVNLGIEDFELDLFGRLRSLSDAARERFLASVHGKQAARGALIAEVLRAYSVERASAAAQICFQAIDADSAALLAYANRQHEVGLLSTDGLDRQRSESDRAHVRALRAEDEHRAAVRALQILVGYQAPAIEPGSITDISSVSASSWDAALRNLDSRVLLERPDIQQAEAELRARNADIGAARAAFFPSVRLSTAIGIASPGLGSLFDSSSGEWLFTPQISLPIFNYGRNSANLRLTELRKEAGVAEYEKAIQQAFREVADALDAHTPLIVAEARERERITRERKRIDRMDIRATRGLEDRTALLGARVQVNEINLSYLEAARDLALNKVALFHAFYGVKLPASL
ncbi:outer membrane channel protein [Burkholderia sp. Bp9140]|uniref:efflux transporter outer membrane subunit n=1 Tax=Burkholderia sp. Bp9140 TaxID=2184572 RepID=UPI000F588C27|nr:efflux transporter outer membrane subunit [Burkholderia sp. Bp9140]RQR51351.1 outer membrane channel protein [Burkholderia sp. Bp9140]